MGEHTGWAVYEVGGRHRAQVRIPALQKYRTKTFDDRREAETWARKEAALVFGGKPSETLLAPVRATTATLKDAYVKNLLARGRSKSHLNNVGLTLEDMAEAAPDLASPSAAIAIESWLDGLAVSPASRNRKLVEIRGFCRWLMKRELLAKDPTRVIERSSVPDYLREQFSVAELVKILAFPTPDPVMHRRFALLTLAGLRSDEAAALQWGDIDLDGGAIMIRNHEGFRLKRGRERIVPLQPALRVILGEPGEPDAQVAPVTDTNMRRGIPLFLGKLGVPVNGRSAHSCRHTYAGLMTATGVPTALVGAYLGHTSAATTLLYTKLAARFVNAVEGWKRGELALV
jgi:integrase